MTAPTPPRSSTYGPGALFSAAVGLIVVAATLVVLGAVVHEANADDEAERVVPGSISVVGSAKIRQWRGPGFTVGVPAAWRLIATGEATFKGASSRTELRVHRWEGLPEGAAARPVSQTGGVCDPAAVCLDVRAERVDAEETASNFAKKRVLDATLESSRGANRDRTTLGSIDLGPVTARGGRWVRRWYAESKEQAQTSYFFLTCEGSKPALGWEVRLVSLRGAVPTDQFASVLGSLDTDGPSPPKEFGQPGFHGAGDDRSSATTRPSDATDAATPPDGDEAPKASIKPDCGDVLDEG